jgi:hypothetical protein
MEISVPDNTLPFLLYLLQLKGRNLKLKAAFCYSSKVRIHDQQSGGFQTALIEWAHLSTGLSKVRFVVGSIFVSISVY